MPAKPCPAIERALAKVDKDGPGQCWVWTGVCSRGGYGQVRSDPPRFEVVYAHRLFYETYVGPIPEGWQIDHLCRNRACVNPEHLEAVTQHENLARGKTLSAANLAKTHCVHGHEFDEKNTYRNSAGYRTCRACRTSRERHRRRA